MVQALKGSIKTSALGSVADPDPLHLAGSGFTSIRAPDPDPLRFLFPDLDPLKKALIWIRVAPKQKILIKIKCFFDLRNAFAKLWR